MIERRDAERREGRTNPKSRDTNPRACLQRARYFARVRTASVFRVVGVLTLFLPALSTTAIADGKGRDFTAEVKALYAVAACGEAPPPNYDARAVAGHCKEMAGITTTWRTKWRDKAAPFFEKLLAGGYPSTVVYPFGGGDLATVLTVYPSASDYTTLSLEGMGDPRPVLQVAQLRPRLDKLRRMLAANLGWAWNTTIQLSIDSSETGTTLPGILSIALTALDANGYEAVELRYFRIGPDGEVRYITQADVDEFDAAQPKAGKRRHKHTNSVQQGLFNNAEITFRKKGDASAPKKTFRHIAWDLSDKGLEANPGALLYLQKKTHIAAMTKAASYLLWKADFSKIRNYLLGNMKLMVSDDTGVPPKYAKPAGFAQEVWGSYGGAFFDWARGRDGERDMIAYWATQPKRPMPFRFGYYDRRRTPVLLYTYKK